MASQHSTNTDFTSRYKFNAKELDTETGWYYYGARYYNPSTSTWLSVDPLAEDYKSWSPYNYTLNNPINFIDPDGRSVDDWVDKNGNKVYVIKNGKGSYTKYATADHKRFGNSLLKTPQGRIQLKKLVNSSIPIRTIISLGKGPSKGSSYITGQTAKTINGKTREVSKAEITIYVGRIKDFSDTIDKFYDKGMKSKLDEQSQLFHENTDTMDEKIASVAGHEIEHAASKANYNLSSDKIEIKPEEIETRILRQTPGSKLIKTNPEPVKIDK